MGMYGLTYSLHHPRGCTWMVNLIMYIPCGNDANRSPWQRKKRVMPQKRRRGGGGGFVGKQNRC